MLTTENCPDTLHKKLMALTKHELIDIMYEALNLMNEYNGRSQMYCICLAMGGKPVETDSGYRFEFKK